MIIDAHVHISDNGKWFDTGLDASSEYLIDQLDKAGIDKAVLLPTYSNCRNKTVFDACKKYPLRFIGFATIDVHNIPNALDELGRCFENYNLKGLKLHPRFQKFKPLDQKLYPIYEKVIEYGWPIVFDGFLQSKDIPITDLFPVSYDVLAKQFPDLKIIIAHAGGHRFWDSLFIAKSNPNVYLDISYIFKYFKPLSHIISELKFVVENCDQKIIFGSDFPEIAVNEYFDLINLLFKELNPVKKKNVFSETICGLVK